MRFDVVPRLASLQCDGNNGLVAYFSMEIAVSPAIPTYSGGLGVLAGDTLRAAADMGLPLVAVTLAHHLGYFRQHLDAKGMLCPMPVISVKRAIKDLQRGQVLAVSATDKGACRDVPAWAEQTGHTLLEQTEENGVYTFYIEKAGWEDEE